MISALIIQRLQPEIKRGISKFKVDLKWPLDFICYSQTIYYLIFEIYYYI